MITLSKITWQEFQIIVKIVEKYQFQYSTFPVLLPLFKSTKKQPLNVVIEDIPQEDFHKILVLIDMYNAISEEEYNETYNQISSKLQRIYFTLFQEHALLED